MKPRKKLRLTNKFRESDLWKLAKEIHKEVQSWPEWKKDNASAIFPTKNLDKSK